MEIFMPDLDVNKIKDLYAEKRQSVKEIARELDISVWTLYSFMERNNIQRRSYSDANYAAGKHKPQFKVKDNLTIAEEKLKIAGIMLYWAEGTLRGCTVDFANSNPQMIKIFLKFLRDICGIKDERLRVYLYAYSYYNLDELKKFWHDVTGIPLEQFTKPYVRRGSPNLSDRKLLYGLVHIRYNDKKLLKTIDTWIKEYSCSF